MAMGTVSGRFGFGLGLRAALGAAAVLLVVAAPALAQFRGPMGRVGEPDVTTDQIQRMAEMLSLTEEQQTVVKELQSAYMGEIQALADEARKTSEAARDEFRESRDPSVWRDLGDVMQKFEDKKKTLTDGLMSDIRLVLTGEQDAKWPDVERYHRRATTMSEGGLISGEEVDVIEAVRTLDLPTDEQQKVDPLLQQYALEVDRALVERKKAYDEGREQGRTMFFNRNFDDMEKLFEKSRDAAVKLRDVNLRYARQVENVLGADEAAKLEREVDKRSFPQVYRETYAEKAFAAAAGIEGLSAEQQKQISDLNASFQRDLASANKKLADAIAESEMTRTVRSMFGRGPGGGGPGGRGDDEPDAVRAAREAKRDLSSRMLDQLRSALGDLSSKLPEREGVENWRNQDDLEAQ